MSDAGNPPKPSKPLAAWRPVDVDMMHELTVESERERARERVREILEEMHGMCAVVGFPYVARAEGAAWLAEQLGAIDHEEYVRYTTRIHYCPGHAGGQVWCAYCGDVDKDTGDVLTRATRNPKGRYGGR